MAPVAGQADLGTAGSQPLTLEKGYQGPPTREGKPLRASLEKDNAAYVSFPTFYVS
jgi:hypothetical protein